MRPVDAPEIRASFVNCSKGEAKRLNLPRDLAEQEWDGLDFLGWRDPQSPGRSYLVAEHEGRLCGIVLRAPSVAVGRRASMCSLCLTVRSGGVALMVAPRAGKAGQRGHSVGTAMCVDLACSLHVRGVVATTAPAVYETLTVDEKVQRLTANVDTFLARVLREV